MSKAWNATWCQAFARFDLEVLQPVLWPQYLKMVGKIRNAMLLQWACLKSNDQSFECLIRFINLSRWSYTILYCHRLLFYIWSCSHLSPKNPRRFGTSKTFGGPCRARGKDVDRSIALRFCLGCSKLGLSDIGLCRFVQIVDQHDLSSACSVISKFLLLNMDEHGLKCHICHSRDAICCRTQKETFEMPKYEVLPGRTNLDWLGLALILCMYYVYTILYYYMLYLFWSWRPD